ncbi:exopolysaccharide transport family protein [soil metagenome]
MRRNLPSELDARDESLMNLDGNSHLATGHARSYGGQRNLSARDVATVLFRRKMLIATLFLTIAAGAAVVTFLLPNQYESRMKILVKNARADVVVTPERTGETTYHNVTETQINSEIELLKSKDLLEQVAIKSGLADQKPPTPSVTDVAASLPLEKSIRQLEKDLEVIPVKKADIIQVTYTARSPELAASVLQNLRDLYLEKHLKLHRPPGTYEFFKTQADQHKDQLRGAELKRDAFQQRMNVVALDQEKELNLRKMADAKSQLLESDTAVREAGERIAKIEEQLSTLEPRILTQSRVIPNQQSAERLNTMLVELRNRRTELLTKFQPDERLVKQVEQQIEDTNAALEKSLKSAAVEESTDLNPLRQTLLSELSKEKLQRAGQRARRDNLARQTQQYQALLSKLESGTTEHNNLAREITTAEGNHQLYAKKQEEARIADALDEQKITNVSIAEAPTTLRLPSKPNRPLNLALGLFLAGFVSLGSVFCFEFFRDTVHTPRELESFTGLTVLATVPKGTLREIRKGIEEKREDEMVEMVAS